MRATHSFRFAVIAVLALGLPVASLAGRLIIAPDRVAAIQNPESQNDTRFLVGFEVPPVLAQGTVELAIAEFRATVTSSDTGAPVMIDAFLVTSEWDEASVVWGGGWETPGGDFDRTVHAAWTAVPGDTSLVRLDLTDMVSTWAGSESVNHGVIVTVAAGERGRFIPRCLASASEQPRLILWYTPRRE